MILNTPHRFVLIVALAAMLPDAPSAWAQTAAAPTVQVAPGPARPDALPDNPGLLNELGKLFVKPADLFPSLKLSPDAAAPAASPAQPGDLPVTSAPPAAAAPAPPAIPPASSPAASTTATAPSRSPAVGLVPQVVSGRAPCPVASNGAPDCKTGADRLCRDKGFAGGSSLGTDSMQTCSTKALLAGARTIKDVCRTENFVTRAMCQ